MFADFKELSAFRKIRSISARWRFPGLIKAVVIGNFTSCVFAVVRRMTSYILVAPNGSETLVQPLDKVLVAITVSGPDAFIWPRVTVPRILVPSSQCAPMTRFVVEVCGRAGITKRVIMQSKTKTR